MSTSHNGSCDTLVGGTNNLHLKADGPQNHMPNLDEMIKAL